jgi:hypothetical protein
MSTIQDRASTNRQEEPDQRHIKNPDSKSLRLADATRKEHGSDNHDNMKNGEQ